MNEYGNGVDRQNKQRERIVTVSFKPHNAVRNTKFTLSLITVIVAK